MSNTPWSPARQSQGRVQTWVKSQRKLLASPGHFSAAINTCDSYATHRDEVAQLDPAIRWLTAPVALWEQRLINGMTALESILDRTAPDGTRLFLSNSAFKKVAKAVRVLLKEQAAPEGMLVKLPDLNRRAFKEQLLALLEHRKIFTNDLSEGWLDDVVKSRNHLVHTGVAPETEEQSGVSVSQIVQVREVVTRLILERIGFVGSYQSWLHNDRALHFPDCERMDLWVARDAADPIPLSDV